MSDRGQTLYDYVAGISVFVITITVILGFLPSIVAPYQGENSAAHAAQADRIGDSLVSNVSVDGAPNRLNDTELATLMEKNATELTSRYGLEAHRHVNVTIETLDGSSVVANETGHAVTTGDTAAGEDATSAARVVTLPDSYDDCATACRLVVRVW